MADVENSEESQVQVEDKKLTQEEVNRIVAREKNQATERATEKARREIEQQYAQEREQLAALKQQQNQFNQNTSQEVDVNRITEDVRNQLQKQIEEERYKEQMNQIANNYFQKVEEGKKKYEDFEKITSKFNPTKFPEITILLSGIENGGEVLYDLSKNTSKLSSIDTLAQRDPELARDELLRLSQSISQNSQALNQEQSSQMSAPLDRLNPSRISNKNGKMSISDMRNMDWLRG